MYKIYQLQCVNEVRTLDNKRSYNVRLNVIGEYSESRECNDTIMLAESVWDACNVACWCSDWKLPEVVVKDDITFYPTENFQGYCNSDIVVETKDGLFLAKTCGFQKVTSLDEAIYRIINSFGFIRWEEIRDKSGLDEKEYQRVGEVMHKEFEVECAEHNSSFLDD